MYGGYCFINNAAVAAQRLLDKGAAKVAVLDVDFHHGNGTQDIFYERGDVFFASLHGDPADAFPHFLGYAEETGKGAGEGTTQNYPMPPGTPYSVWEAARGRGHARALMAAAEAEALARGRTVLVLDTATGSPAEAIYARLGWSRVGVIPDYALYPDGSFCATTLFFKRLGESGM